MAESANDRSLHGTVRIIFFDYDEYYQGERVLTVKDIIEWSDTTVDWAINWVRTYMKEFASLPYSVEQIDDSGRMKYFPYKDRYPTFPR